MKRITAAAAFAVALSGFAFAETGASGLAIGGEILTGARIELDQETGNTAQLYSDTNDVDGVGAAFKLHGAYDAGNYGAYVEFDFADGDAAQTGGILTPVVGYSYGWMKFFDDTVTLKAGLVEETAFDSVGEQEIRFFDKDGFVATWTPVEGLAFGAAAGLGPALLTAGTPAPLSSVYDALAFGARYSGDAFTVEAAITTGHWTVYGDPSSGTAAYAQFGITAVENLQAEADALFIGLTDFAERGTLVSTEFVGYTAGRVTPSLLCRQTVAMDDIASAEYTFEPEIAYELSESFSPYVGGEFAIVGAETSYAGKLGLDAQVSPNALVAAWYRLASSGADHTFQIDLSWYF